MKRSSNVVRITTVAVSYTHLKLLKTLTYEVLDTLIMQLEVRFSDFKSIQFVELLDPNHFISYKESFPSTKLNSLINKYPFFNSERLENELKNIYSDTGKHLFPQRLLHFIILNDLEPVYVEVSKLIRLILTFPVTTASSETVSYTHLDVYKRQVVM